MDTQPQQRSETLAFMRDLVIVVVSRGMAGAGA